MYRQFIIWIIFITVAIAAQILILAYNDATQQEYRALSIALSTNIRNESKADLARVEIIFENGRRRMFQGNLGTEIFTLRSALEAITNEGKFVLAVKNGQIESLAGLGKPNQWKIYRNNKLQKESLDQLKISGGDLYSLRQEI